VPGPGLLSGPGRPKPLFFQRLEPALEVRQVVTQPDDAYPAARDLDALLGQRVADADMTMFSPVPLIECLVCSRTVIPTVHPTCRYLGTAMECRGGVAWLTSQ
jgi:hypothetical protein